MNVEYDFVCPTRGIVGFLPYMIALTLTPERICPLCNLPVGQAKTDTPPSAPEGQPSDRR